MNQRQCKPNGERRKSGRRLAMRRAHDDEQEHGRHHELGERRGAEAVLAGGMLRVSVRRKSVGKVEARSAAGDEIQDGCGGNAADYLGNDVGRDLPRRKTAADG